MPRLDPTLLTVRVSSAQRDALREEAARRGVTQSDLVREGLQSVGVPLWRPLLPSRM